MRHSRLKYLADIIPGQSPPSTEVSYLDGGLPFIQGNAEFGELTPKPVWQCEESPKIAEAGDVLVSVRAPVGAVNIAVHRMGIGRGVAAIRPKKSNLSKWIYWALIAHKQDLLADATGSTFSAVSGTDVGNLRLSLSQDPTVVADFLDRETAEIDAFIADQERLIELLEERRAATITHAVTKGLDPNVPMKETDLEWAPLIPQHWKINKISRSFRASKGQNAAALTHEYCASIPGPYPVYSGQTENAGVMALIDDYEFDAGKTGVLFTTTVGSQKVMSMRHLYGKFSLSQNCMIIFPIKELVIRYYYYQFQTLFEYQKGNIPQHMQASFRMSDLNQYRYLQPPSQEEHQIADYLDREMEELDAAVSDAREAIALSRERRAALISAAVTGQLDVSQAPSRGSAAEVLEDEVRV